MGQSFLGGNTNRHEALVKALGNLTSEESFGVTIDHSEFISGKFKKVSYNTEPKSGTYSLMYVGDYIEQRVVFSNTLPAQTKKKVSSRDANKNLSNILHLTVGGGSSANRNDKVRHTVTVNGVSVYTFEETVNFYGRVTILYGYPGAVAGAEVIYRCEHIGYDGGGTDGYNGISLTFGNATTPYTYSDSITWRGLVDFLHR